MPKGSGKSKNVSKLGQNVSKKRRGLSKDRRFPFTAVVKTTTEEVAKKGVESLFKAQPLEAYSVTLHREQRRNLAGHILGALIKSSFVNPRGWGEKTIDENVDLAIRIADRLMEKTR